MKTPNGDEVISIRGEYNGYNDLSPGIYFCILYTKKGYQWSIDYTPEELVEDFEGERDEAIRSLREEGLYFCKI